MISEIQCPRQGECCSPGVEKHVRIRSVAGADLVECQDNRSRNCRFAMPFGYSVFCRCPVRKYLAEHGLPQ
ncbi:MAG: hypothetical protein KBE65_11790 [Phycisphaerae bacterium]|nr:hypothetical protein [Phycisphaerae bacterium]